MFPGKSLPRARGIPSLFRSLGMAAFFIGVLMAYVDTHKMAARRIVLNARVTASQEIGAFVETGAVPPGGEVSLRARAVPGMRFGVSYRVGLARREAQVVPLWSTWSGTAPMVLGFAFAGAGLPPLVVKDGASGTVEVLGLAQSPGNLAAAVHDMLLASGIPVAEDLVGVMPYLQGREAVLSAPVRNPWRSVLFWLSAVLLVGGHILNIEGYRIRAERRRIALARSSTGTAGRSKASDRFMPLAEHPESGADRASEGDGGWIARARRFISRAV